jgi:flavorubredoxin
MYQTSLELVQNALAQLNAAGIKAVSFDLIRQPLRDLAGYLVDARTIVLACSMVLGGPHPAAMNFAYLAKLLRPKAKNLGIIGSYGWGGKLADPLIACLEGVGANVLPPLLFKGKATPEDLAKLDALVQLIIKNHQNA